MPIVRVDDVTIGSGQPGPGRSVYSGCSAQ